MKRLALLISFLGVVAFAAGRDSHFDRIGSVTTGTGATNLATGLVGLFIKVSCVQDAYVGLGPTNAVSCLAQTDGGRPCDLIRFSLGEKFHAKTLSTHTHVAVTMVDAGVQTCDVFAARN